jgi:SPP1 gp7 family putative phage head morphogenesis protein
MMATRTRRPNPLRRDPTRTASLRRRLRADLRRRFARVRREVIRLVLRDDSFGLRPAPPRFNPFAVNEPWRGLPESEQLRAFRLWLRDRFGRELTGRDAEEAWRLYVEEGFRQGAGRAFDDTRRLARVGAEVTGTTEAFLGGREEFLRSAFGRPVAVEKVQLLADRAFDELEGVTQEMATRMTRTLADGLVRGESPRDLARDLAEDVDIGLSRAERIARTEISRTHAEGQLVALEELGVEELGVMVEWLVTDDDKLCEICAPLEGQTFTLEEARGMLPRHPNCRCAWAPAVPSAKGGKR